MQEITLIKSDFRGSYLSNTKCALAKALRRKFEGATVLVGDKSVSINGKNYVLPKDQDVAIRREYLYEESDRGPLTVKFY